MAATTIEPARASDQQAVRQRLIDAAVEVFSERGYDGAGVAEIARRAGLTTGAIYSRFSGKAELLAEAIADRMAHQLARLFDPRGDADPTGVIGALGSMLLEPREIEGSQVAFEAFAAARRDPEVAELLTRRIDHEDERFAVLIDEARRIGLVDPNLDIDAVVALIHSIGFGFVTMRILGRPMPDAASWDTLVGRLISACAPVPTEPTSPTPSS